MNKEKLKRRWQKEDELRIDSALSKVMADPEGRKFLWWLLEIGRIGMQPFSGNALNTAFTCGELNVGQKILDRIITVSAEGYVLMMKESQSEFNERSKQLSDDPADGAGEEDGSADEGTG
jgi:hypothetical protein